MSADDGIAVRKLSNGKWAARHFFLSDVAIPSFKDVPDQYDSREEVIAAYKQRANESEYGFYFFDVDDVEPKPIIAGYTTADPNELPFRDKLQHLINYCSLESSSNTPDFILAEYLEGCLAVFDKAVSRRDSLNS